MPRFGLLSFFPDRGKRGGGTWATTGGERSDSQLMTFARLVLAETLECSLPQRKSSGYEGIVLLRRADKQALLVGGGTFAADNCFAVKL